MHFSRVAIMDLRKVFIILVIICMYQYNATPVIKITEHLIEQEPDADKSGNDEVVMNPSPPSSSDEECNACQKLRQELHKPLSPEELRQARLEHIKKTILEKLRMTHPPNITRPLKQLPEPLLRKHGGVFAHEGRWKGDRTEHYYAETEEVITFAHDVQRCTSDVSSMCFSIQIRHNIDPEDIKSAKLYIRATTASSVRLHLHDVTSNGQLIHTLKSDSSSPWIHVNIQNTFSQWMANALTTEIHLKLTCHHCDVFQQNTFQEDLEQHTPFLELRTQEGQHRSRRNVVECQPGSTSCCKASLNVSFAEIGWDSWIHNPANYSANYCMGSCAGPHENPAFQHSRVMMDVQKEGQIPRIGYEPCCSPTRLSKLSLVYTNDDGEILKTNLPNMVVEACGCA